ncbi:DUF3710 domain-containing protein, partial [Micromonospora sp. WMMD736]|uniref:DUF3710 domain-containing protein n=1 Tax=Micromonospora sp. WMMD736 TaxID=3404112 RepID=UPI003B92619B
MVVTVPPADMRVCDMAFGKNKSGEKAGDTTNAGDPGAVPAPGVDEDFDGPFDIDDFDEPAVAAQGRLDLGSVLIPMPQAGQVQVELNQAGIP